MSTAPELNAIAAFLKLRDESITPDEADDAERLESAKCILEALAALREAPVAWRVLAEPNLPVHFALTKADAEHLVNNLLTYRRGCTSARIEPLYASPANEAGAPVAVKKAFFEGFSAGEASGKFGDDTDSDAWDRYALTHPQALTASPAEAPVAVKALPYGQKLIAEAIESHFGERLEDYDEDVDDTSNHDAWEAFDAMRLAYPAPAPVDMAKGKIIEFATAILHGDDEHREWLMGAALAFNAGDELPAPRGKGTASPASHGVVEALLAAKDRLQFGFHSDREINQKVIAQIDASLAPALAEPQGVEMVLVPKAEFDALYEEADSLARRTDYEVRLDFKIAKHSFDNAMAGKASADVRAAAPEQEKSNG